MKTRNYLIIILIMILICTTYSKKFGVIEIQADRFRGPTLVFIYCHFPRNSRTLDE